MPIAGRKKSHQRDAMGARLHAQAFGHIGDAHRLDFDEHGVRGQQLVDASAFAVFDAARIAGDAHGNALLVFRAALGFGVEQAQRLDDAVKAFDAQRRFARERKDVEDVAAQTDLARGFSERLARVAAED